MQRILEILISKEIIWGAIIAFSMAFLFMHFIPNQRSRTILRIVFWSLLIFGPSIIRWWVGDSIWIAEVIRPICVVELIA